MKPSYNRRRGGGLYCCWILTITLFVFILINLSQGQPQNYFKGTMTQLPSKALPRIGRRSGAVAAVGDDEPSPPEEQRVDTTMSIDEVDNSMDPYHDHSSHPIYNNEYSSPLFLGGDSSSNNDYGRTGFDENDEDPRTNNNNINNRLLSDSEIQSIITKPNSSKDHHNLIPDRGLIYMWKSFAKSFPRRESETGNRRGNGGFRQSQPTGIHQFRRRSR